MSKVKAWAVAVTCLLATGVAIGTSFGQEKAKGKGKKKQQELITDSHPENIKIVKGPGVTAAAEKLGWRLGAQAYTFRDRPFFNAIDQIAALGLHYVELYPNQRVSTDLPQNVTTHHNMTPEVMEQIQKKLQSANVKAVSYGVIKPKGEAEWRKTFEFAKKMGLENIVSEPDESEFAMLDKLTEEFGINVAIHNHPKPTHYWDCEVELKAITGHSTRIGACADMGHWVRSGLKPVDCLKKLEGRIIESHFKDLNEFGVREAHDVPWGTGISEPKAILEELKRQNARVAIFIEYERLGPNLADEVAKSMEWFNKTVEELAGK